MVKRNRSGFTLIELMIALAVFGVILSLLVASLSRVLAMEGVYQQELDVQQNFRFAVDSITNDARLATQITLYGGTDSSLQMTQKIAFTTAGNHIIRYVAEQTDASNSSSPWVIRRYDNDVAQPVTEEIPQLLKVYFINSGRKVFVILSGRLKYSGRARDVCLVSLVWARNLLPSN